jgi:membrane protease YdiL (CAAX protease family)
VTVVTEPARYLAADEFERSTTTHQRLWTSVTALEVAAACAAIVADLAVPSLVLLLMASVSLLARRAHWSSLGFHPSPDAWLAPMMLAFAAVWSVFQLGVTMPIANHVSGREQDLTGFNDFRGNVGMLVGFLLLGWTVAAVIEELADRGYLQTRLRQLLGNSAAALVVTVLLSSLLFGRVHSEQGLVGMLVVTIDGIAWSVLRYRYKTLWASVLAHGFNNTIGFVAFFVVGPIHGLW